MGKQASIVLLAVGLIALGGAGRHVHAQATPGLPSPGAPAQLEQGAAAGQAAPPSVVELRVEPQPTAEEKADASMDPTVPIHSRPLLQLPQRQGAEGDVDEEEVSVPGDPWGDVGSEGLISLRALFQARYVSTFARRSRSESVSYALREDNLAQQNDGFSLNRVFLRVGADPSRYVGFKAVIDFGELMDGDPEDVLKQAYASLRFIPKRLELVAGLFKLPFSVVELDASSRFEFADFGQTNRLIGDLGYAGRDLGVQVLAAPLRKAKRLRLTLGAFRGHMYDEHDSPLGAVAGRIETKPNKALRFGADIVQHTKTVTYNRPFNTSDKDELPTPLPNPLFPAQKRWDKGHAFSVDARYKKKGLMVRGEFIYGDRIDIDERYGAKTFWAAWGLCAYRIDLSNDVRLLPAIRYEWLDADREHAHGGQQQLSFALNLLFWERVRFVLEAVRTDVQANTPLLNQPKPLASVPYLALDNTRVLGQLQLEL